MARKSKGRQKVEMTRMSKESNLLVTFSKRRSGLFKKASELCTLCGAEIAIIVFSPGKKAFSFGHPCVDTIIDRFLSRSASTGSGATAQMVEAHRNASVRELNAQLTEVMNQLEGEKKRGEELMGGKARKERCWWEAPIQELGMQQLEQLKAAMEDLKKNVTKQVEKAAAANNNNNNVNVAPPSFFIGSSSSTAADVDVKLSAGHGLGLSMTPQGYTLGYGYGRGFF
ncbi:agamous-like MADS-box protein AGL62 [Diospyros lotus]|uniref:agamous-like MADS-box protein AGL62 n=1 Tax=Diospyros lotus TaxID=55363 RepID=UPI00224FCAB0|nr:agamous-like MADS-box protein AGL62 [Diospyros lotus]